MSKLLSISILINMSMIDTCVVLANDPCKHFNKVLGADPATYDKESGQCKISVGGGRSGTVGTPTPGGGAGSSSGTSAGDGRGERVQGRRGGGSSSTGSSNPPTARKPAMKQLTSVFLPPFNAQLSTVLNAVVSTKPTPINNMTYRYQFQSQNEWEQGNYICHDVHRLPLSTIKPDQSPNSALLVNINARYGQYNGEKMAVITFIIWRTKISMAKS